MSKKFYSLKKESEGRQLFISKNDMDVLTDNPNEALAFFSENHVSIWKKCNPTFTDAIIVEMSKDDNGIITEVTSIKKKIILAFQDNHKDLLKARMYGDQEEIKFCDGYESAMTYVLSLYGIDYDDALLM